jgi:predicted metal-dependent HD superfamily phosphohydrolase
MDDSQFQRATQYAEDLLRSRMLPAFTYHNVSHTLDVVQICDRLAELEGIDEKSRRLLTVAAYFHDTGLTAISDTELQSFNAGRAVHEEKAVEIASSFLSDCGFPVNEVETITRLIMATKWGHTPVDKLEQIISDADMSSIGQTTDSFMGSSNALRDELKAFGIENEDVEWYTSQKELLETYAYHTPSARSLFDGNRLSNSAAVQSHLDSLVS